MAEGSRAKAVGPRTPVPLATGAAILRYRLYDLDRIISRTVAWGLLTVLLGLGYAAVVLGLGRLLPDRSTLARGRRHPDRGRRYDAARTIEGFSGRLRDQVDLDTLSTELLAVVGQTVQPTRARRSGCGRPER